VVLAIGHALRAHEALSRPYALPASFRLSIAPSRTVSSSAMTEAYGQASSDPSITRAGPQEAFGSGVVRAGSSR
jgi:hypothetical protein